MKKFKLERVAQELYNYSKIFKCSYEESWNKYLPELFTKDYDIKRVVKFIEDQKVIADMLHS